MKRVVSCSDDAVSNKRFPFQIGWPLRVAAVQQLADALPPGPERDALLKKARQADTASYLSQRLTSPGLQPPRSSSP